MYPKLYDINGDLRAVLDNVVKDTASIKRVVNGEFTFTFEAFEKELKSEYFDPSYNLVVDDQTFDMKYIVLKHEEDEITYSIQCEHVNYRMADGDGNVYESYAYTGTPTEILTNILSGTEFSVGVVDFTDPITISVNTKVTRKALIYELTNLLEGEIEYSNKGFTINILDTIGQNNGFQVRFGKNLEGVSKILDSRGGSVKVYYEVDILELKNSNEYIEKDLRDLEVVGVGDTIRVIDKVIGLDIENRVLSIEYNPIMAINTKLEIANTIELITDKINQIDTETVKQDRLYNNVSISQDYGFRAVRSDKKARATMSGGTISLDVGDGDDNWTPAIYFDVETGQYVFVGDGIFEGTVYAENIDTTRARIQVAQIEDLIVGNNVVMGPDAVISWAKLTDVPSNIVYQETFDAIIANYPTETELANTLASYTTNTALAVALAGYITSGALSTTLVDYLTNGDFDTLIGQDYIVTGKIAANQIAVGTLTGFTIKTANDNVSRIVMNSSGYKTYNALNQLHGVYMDVLGGSSSFRVFDSDILKYSLFYGMVEGDSVNKVRLTSVGCPMKISAGSDNMSISAATIYMEGNVNFNGTVTGVNAIAKFA